MGEDQRKLVWAYTEPGIMPAYINMSEHSGGMVRITVRSVKKPPGKLPYEVTGDVAEIDLPRHLYLEMFDALQTHAARKILSRSRALEDTAEESQ